MPHLPFCKPKPLAVVIPLRLPYRGPGLVTDRLNHPIIDITSPWPKRENFMQGIIREYRDTFPAAAHPSNTDLLEWMHKRAIDAEKEIKFLKDQINIYETGMRGI